MFGLDSAGAGEVLVLFVVILIVVGPKRLPAVARKLGRTMEMFRRAADEFKAQIMTMDREAEAGHAPADAGGESQASAEASSGDAYSQPYQDAPYPGNEQYAEALGGQPQQADGQQQPEASGAEPTEGSV